MNTPRSNATSIPGKKKTLKAAIVTLAVLFAITASASGCGASCEDLCNKGAACGSAPQQGCASECSEVDALNSSSGCGSQWSTELDCYNSNSSQLCGTGSGPCASQELAWGSCVEPYCAANPNDANCKALGIGGDQ